MKRPFKFFLIGLFFGSVAALAGLLVAGSLEFLVFAEKANVPLGVFMVISGLGLLGGLFSLYLLYIEQL